MPRMCIRAEPRGIHGAISARGGPVRVVGLPVQHHAGQGAGDAVQDLNAEDDQPAELIETGRLHSGDDVVGAGDVFSQLHTIARQATATRAGASAAQVALAAVRAASTGGREEPSLPAGGLAGGRDSFRPATAVRR